MTPDTSPLPDEDLGWLTPDELEACQHLHRRTPYAIMNVLQTQFSIARHYGGITYNGDGYVYLPEHDQLIRDDVFKLVMKLRKAAKKRATPAPTAGGDLFGCDHA